MQPPAVIAGSASRALAEGLAKELGTTPAPAECRRFPDGEGYVRLTQPVKGRDAIIVQSTLPDANLVELLLWQDAAWESGAASVTCVIPYFAYARQDRIFQPGEAVSSRAAARAIATGCDRVILVDPHKEDVAAFFGGKAESVSAVGILAQQLRTWGVDTMLAPDKGARQRAEQAAKIIGVPVDHLEKTRLSPTEVRMAAKELDVRGRRVAILDDLIASGATMLTAAKQLKHQGAKSVVAACTHGLFSGEGGAQALIAGGLDRLLCTDTLVLPAQRGCDIVSAAPAVAAALRVERPALL